MSLLVKESGLYTTIQDLGRYGYLQYGIPSSGVLDFRSHILVNKLLGNDINDSTIEMTYIGARFVVEENCHIAVVGADMSFSINDVASPRGVVTEVNKDDHIVFGKAKTGMRVYLGISGGFKSQKILGSSSTHESIKINHRLKSGDKVSRYEHHIPSNTLRLKGLQEDNVIHVLAGQQFDYFNDMEIDKFFNQTYEVSPKSDRMGQRLEGEGINSEKGFDILSEPTLLGSIQIPGDGKPIILLNERQTIGGYPKIATVIKADIPKLVQFQPNEKISFKQIEIDEAIERYDLLMDRLNQNYYIEVYYDARNKTSSKISKILGGE